MTVIKAKPTSPGRRFVVSIKNEELHKGKPHKPLISTQTRSGGRNNQGRMTVRHRGGGHKKQYRIIDFKRNKYDIPATVVRIEHDPNRNAYIALVCYKDGEKRYIIAPKGLKSGDVIISSQNVPVKPGNASPIRNIPVGTVIHNVELKPLKGAQLARSAGTYVQLVSKDLSYAIIKLRSGERRKVLLDCCATIGEVSNSEFNLRSLGKAGAKRWAGRRPKVRGVAMNPVDHPHGGGEGKTAGGRHPVSPTGVPAKGYKTRKNKRSDKWIVQKRK